jgi:hypothetical protein
MAKNKHHTFLGKIFGSAWDWVKEKLAKADDKLLDVAIHITNLVKDALNSGVVDIITAAIPGTLDDKLVAIVREKIPLILSKELLLKAVGTPATEEEAKALTEELLAGFGVLSDADKAEFYTTVAAKVYMFLHEHEHGEKVTFGEAASLAEDMYQAWLKSQK